MQTNNSKRIRKKLGLSEIHNLENVVQGDEYFSSCGHLNDARARMFTEVVLERFFGKKQTL